jgi:hypothetical protein
MEIRGIKVCLIVAIGVRYKFFMIAEIFTNMTSLDDNTAQIDNPDALIKPDRFITVHFS